jgi:hypothetical protein
MSVFRVAQESRPAAATTPLVGVASPVVLCAIASVLCAALFLEIFLATGPIGSDDIAYFRGAVKILHEGWLPQVDTLVGRKLFILLVGVPAALGGHIIYGVMANIFYETILELAVVAFVFREFGAASALVAAVITGLNGITLLWSGTMMSDITVALPMFLSVAALYYALAPSAPHRSMLLLLSGAFAGLAYAIKEPGILLLPPAALSLFALTDERSRWRRAAAGGFYLLGFASLLAAECLVQFWLSGDFFLRYHGLESMQPNPAMSLFDFLRWDYWSLAAIAGKDRNLLLLPILAGLFSWIVVAWRRSSISAFGLTGIFTAGYLIFGSTSLSALHPMPFQTRYFAPLLPLVAVSMGALFANVGAGMQRLVIWIFLGAFACVSIVGAAGEAGNLGRARYFKNVAAALEGELARGHSPIMIDPSTLEVLTQFMPQAAYTRLKPLPAESEPLPAGYYLVDPYQNSIIRLQRAPHFEEISRLPIVATVNLDPFVVGRYFPNFGADKLDLDPRFVAILRKKSQSH